MKSILDRAFDPEYRNGLNQATRQVPLLYAMYVLCIPLSKGLVRLGCSPTAISHASNLLALSAVSALAWAENLWLFPVLWIAALFFDIADGIVARVTSTSSASGSFYDHMSDQIKVILLFLGAAYRYEASVVWSLAYLACTAFLFMNVVNQVYKSRLMRLTAGTHGQERADPPGSAHRAPGGLRAGLRSFLKRHPRLRNWMGGVYASVFAMYGNSMLIVLPLGLGETWAILTLSIFLIVTLRSLFAILLAAAQINRQLTVHRIPWK